MNRPNYFLNSYLFLTCGFYPLVFIVSSKRRFDWVKLESSSGRHTCSDVIGLRIFMELLIVLTGYQLSV